MGKIIIIDDNLKEANYLKEEISEYLDDEVFVLTSIDYDYLKQNKIDLLFLDIRLKNEVNGIDEAIRIREQQTYKMNIIFYSWHDTFIHRSLDVMPIYFIRKDFLQEDTRTTFELLEKNNFRKNDLITLHSGSIQVKDLMYIESLKNYIIFHMNDGTTIKERRAISDFEEEFSKMDIIRCHRSFLVNAKYIKRYIKNIITLQDGTELKISRTYAKNFANKYQEYSTKGL